MKTFPLTRTAMLLLGLATAAVAQDAATKRQMHAMQLEGQRTASKRMMSTFWNGEGPNVFAVNLLQQDTFREGIGVSKEQAQIIRDTMSGSGTNWQDDPRIKPFMGEMIKFQQEHGNPFDKDATEEAKRKFSELQSRIQTKMMDIMQENLTNTINENLTSDQLKKVKEFQISTMSEIPFISPSMFEVLDLSDDQKKQLDKIKKDMEPEFETIMDKLIEEQLEFAEKMFVALEGKLEGVTDPKEQERIRKEAEDAVRKSNPKFQREPKEIMGSGKELADKLKVRMFEVLSDEQWDRMIDLIDNPPDYAKKMIAQLRKKMGTDNSKPEVWTPGPNSWQPGDPIPEGYREQRQKKGNFPRPKQSDTAQRQ